MTVLHMGDAATLLLCAAAAAVPCHRMHLGLQACCAAQVIKKQLTEGVTQRRVGLVSTGAPPRAHSLILNQEGKEVRAPPEENLPLETSCRVKP